MASSLALLVFSPLLAGMFLFVVRKNENWIGVLATFIPIVAAFPFFYQYFVNGIELFSEKWSWIQFQPKGFQFLQQPFSVTIGFELQLDGISLAFIFLTVVLTFFAALVSWKIEEHRRMYFLLLLLLETGMIGLFVAANLFLFFIFFEMTIICLFFLAGKFGDREREKAAFHLLIYNGVGSAFLLFAIVLFFVQMGTVQLEQLQLLLQTGTVSLTGFGKWGIICSILIAFGIKMPVVPFHQWMVSMHAHAHPAVVILHSGVLLKIATYGFYRFGIGLFPNEWEKLTGMIICFALFNVFYGALLALRQTDVRKVWAYSSIAHMGFVLLGFAIGSQTGIQGALFQSISHGLISSLLFLFVALVLTRFHTTNIEKLSGLRNTSPFAVFLLFVGGLASLGLPATSGFIGEFLVILAAFRHHPAIGFFASLGIILATGYMLRTILTISYGRHPSTSTRRIEDEFVRLTDDGKENGEKARVEDIMPGKNRYKVYEWLPAIAFVLLVIGLGIYPEWVMGFFVRV